MCIYENFVRECTARCPEIFSQQDASMRKRNVKVAGDR